MKSINKSLMVAAVLSTALSAMAQNPGGQNPGTGATSTDPSNEIRTQQQSGVNTNADANRDPNANTNAEMNTVGDQNRNRTDSATDGHETSKQKRSFWDRLFGRNKHLEADQNAGDRPAETDASGRRTDAQP